MRRVAPVIYISQKCCSCVFLHIMQGRGFSHSYVFCMWHVNYMNGAAFAGPDGAERPMSIQETMAPDRIGCRKGAARLRRGETE